MRRNSLALLVVAAALLSVAMIGAAVGLGTAGANTTDDPSDDRTITVSATGGADVAPDQGVVQVAVTADGDDPGTVSDDLAGQADELRTALDELGVDYETAHYAVDQPRRPPEERNGAGYEGVHAFEVTVDDPDAVGDVVDAAADVGAEIGNVELTLSEAKRTELREEAIDNAMADARDQAETIAATEGLAVGTAMQVDASQQRFDSVRYDAAVPEADDAAADTSIDAGDVSVSYQVTVTYGASTA